ncbi:MAG: recombinase family protein [Anaerolineae bacterium]|nr:recombinase family protein [Anaerolineae bacterium]
MTIIGYIRVSTEKQDLEKQRHLLLEYAHQQKLKIDEFIEIEISSRKNQRERRISEVIEKLSDGDLLIVAELSRLGRNMQRFRWRGLVKVNIQGLLTATGQNIK